MKNDSMLQPTKAFGEKPVNNIQELKPVPSPPPTIVQNASHTWIWKLLVARLATYPHQLTRYKGIYKGGKKREK